MTEVEPSVVIAAVTTGVVMIKTKCTLIESNRHASRKLDREVDK